MEGRQVKSVVTNANSKIIKEIKKMQNRKTTQPHKTPRFKWFGQTSLHPLAETIQEKFTSKMMEYKE
jgi:hypothetical protein